jgi:hypothetical protein
MIYHGILLPMLYLRVSELMRLSICFWVPRGFDFRAADANRYHSAERGRQEEDRTINLRTWPTKSEITDFEA